MPAPSPLPVLDLGAAFRCPACETPVGLLLDERPGGDGKLARPNIALCHTCGCLFILGPDGARHMTAAEKQRMRAKPRAAEIRAAQQRVVGRMIG